jgi:hypothetical protein
VHNVSQNIECAAFIGGKLWDDPLSDKPRFPSGPQIFVNQDHKPYSLDSELIYAYF